MRMRFVRSGMVVLAMAVATTVARGQDLDAGKSGAQLFAQDCVACHRSPQGLNRSLSAGGLVSFLRQHYTSSSSSANLVASYVLGAGPGPRADRQKGRSGEEQPAAAARDRARTARPAENATPQPQAGHAAGQPVAPRPPERVARPADPTMPTPQLRRPRRQLPPPLETAAPAEEPTQSVSAAVAPAGTTEPASQQSTAQAASSAFTDPLP